MIRKAKLERISNETKIQVEVNLDGKGKYEFDTGIGFFEHMLSAFAKYSKIDMRIKVKGDLETGTHHTIEDTGMVIGSVILKALGDRKGISRAGCFRYLMDDAIVDAAIDISGRSRLMFEDMLGQPLKYSNEFVGPKNGGFPTDEVKEFFWGLTGQLKANTAVFLMRRGNTHHEIECTFKAFARALRSAIEIDPRSIGEIQSTKGMLD